MLVGLLIGVIGFQVILERINFEKIQLVQSMQIKIRNLKSKKIMEYVIMLVVGGILWGAMARSPLAPMAQGMIVGIIWAVIMFIFEDTMFDNAKNTLK